MNLNPDQRPLLGQTAPDAALSDQLLFSDVPGIGRPVESLVPLVPAMAILAIDDLVSPALPFLSYIHGSSIARQGADPYEIFNSFKASKDYAPELSQASRTVSVVELGYQRTNRRFSVIVEDLDLHNREYRRLMQQNPAYRAERLRIRIAKFARTSYDRAERFGEWANIWLPTEITLGPLMVQPLRAQPHS